MTVERPEIFSRARARAHIALGPPDAGGRPEIGEEISGVSPAPADTVGDEPDGPSGAGAETAMTSADGPAAAARSRWADRVAGWLVDQPWFAEPQPSIRALVEHARDSGWTVSDRARSRRLAWLYVVAVPARALCWAATWGWRRRDAQGWSDEQPPLAALVDRSRQAGRSVTWVYAVAVPARIASLVADNAPRTVVAALLAWLAANALAAVPVIGSPIPDRVTGAYWWHLLVETTYHAAGVAGDLAPVVARVVGIVLLVVFAARVAWTWIRGLFNGREDDQ